MSIFDREPRAGDVATGNDWYQTEFGRTKPAKGSVWNGNMWSNESLMNFNDLYQKANPWANQTAQYQNKLAQLLETPGAMASNPAYQYSFDQGMEAINRSAAAKGQLGSGNRLIELTKFGQGQASQNFFNLANLYSKLAGADSQNAAGAVGAAASGINGQMNAMNGIRPITVSSGMDTSKLLMPQMY